MKRKIFLAASAMTAAFSSTACANNKAAELEVVQPQSDFDFKAFTKLVNRPFDVRQLWDINGYVPTALHSIKNAYDGYQFGFGITPTRIGMIACLHGLANTFAYDDSMWSKYGLGQAFDLKSSDGQIVSTNVFYRSPSHAENTLEALQRRGLIVMVCHTAAADQANSLVASGAAPRGASAETVLDDLLSHLVPNVAIVPSMVATIGILQNRFRYAYITDY